MNSDNLMAQNDKIHWEQLDGQPIAIFDNTFLIHYHLIDKFNAKNTRPKIFIKSPHWDYLLFSTKNTNLLAILPSPVTAMVNVQNIVERRFHDPVPWLVALYQPKKSRYSNLEKYVLKQILDYFKRELL